jgi:hypothetical protein
MCWRPSVKLVFLTTKILKRIICLTSNNFYVNAAAGRYILQLYQFDWYLAYATRIFHSPSLDSWFPEPFFGSKHFTHSIWLLMWPICLLFNKILKTEDERELKGETLSAIEPYLFQNSSCNIDSHPPSLRRSLFIDVSACDYWLKFYSATCKYFIFIIL